MSIDRSVALPAPDRGVSPGASVGPGADRPWLLLIWAIVTAYNLFKPFHIDDTAHLVIARWIASHPLRPMSGLLNWSGVDAPIWRTNQPHLYFYLIAGWGSVLGWSEPALHALEALAALACVLLTHRLARVFVPGAALWTAAIVALGPAFAVEQNLMVDVPLLATWLAFFVVLTDDAPDARQARRYGLAACCCAAAMLIKYSSAVLFVVLCLSLLIERRPRQWWAPLIPVGAVVAWSLFNLWDYGGIHILSRPYEGHDRRWIAAEGEAWLLALGALSPLGPVACRALLGLSRRLTVALGVAAVVGVLALATSVGVGVGPSRLAHTALTAAFYGNGALIALFCVREMGRASRPLFRRAAPRGRASAPLYLALWIAGTTAFYVPFAPFIASRHLLLILPAVTILVGRAVPGTADAPIRLAALALTLPVSAGLALSDFRFASFYRTQAVALERSLPPDRARWIGDHWGWQWYATRAGFREIDAHGAGPSVGDIVVLKDAADRLGDAKGRPLRRIGSVREGDPALNLFCTGQGARFYESSAEHPPWTLSRDCGNTLNVYVVGADHAPRADLPDSGPDRERRAGSFAGRK